MRSPRALADPEDRTIPDEPRDPWRNRTTVHLAAGLSVPAAKRIVQGRLDDATFDPERATLMRLPSRRLIDSLTPASGQRSTRVKRRPRSTAAPRAQPRCLASVQQALVVLVLLVTLGLELMRLDELVHDRWVGALSRWLEMVVFR